MGADRFSIPSPMVADKENSSEEQATGNKAAPQNSIICVFQAKVAKLCRTVTVTWSKALMNQILTITMDGPNQEAACTCKIDLKPWQFWGKKGLKSLELDGQRVEVFWDFRQAKFSSSPEPCSDYYVAIVSNEEVSLLLGDMKTEAYKRAKCRPSLVEARMLHKKENVHGKKLFCTRTMLHEVNKEHDIIIENSLSGPGDPEMWISVDGMLVIRVSNLHWRFRGNESVLVYDRPVQIFWDVHDWMFSSSASGQGVFIFKPGTLEIGSASYARSNSQGNEEADFCHFLYAWRSE